MSVLVTVILSTHKYTPLWWSVKAALIIHWGQWHPSRRLHYVLKKISVSIGFSIGIGIGICIGIIVGLRIIIRIDISIGKYRYWNIEKMTKSIYPERPYIELLPNWENHLTALEHPENFFYALKKKFNYILTRLNENILHSIHIRPVKNIWKMK